VFKILADDLVVRDASAIRNEAATVSEHVARLWGVMRTAKRSGKSATTKAMTYSWWSVRATD